ncbi:MAG: hypothetical protein HKN73_18635, partial [Gemmatimonadetes bacterium]|nr:hypothetical protein [Gemmatimonadota bacterium]
PSLFAVLMAAAALIWGRSMGEPAGKIVRVMLAILLGCILSTVWWGIRNPESFLSFSGATQTSVFLLLRVCEGIVVFWAVSRAGLSAARMKALSQAVTVALVITALTVILSYLETIPLSALAPQIPADPGVSGPWSRYHWASGEGWGTVGYNHGYVAAHLLMLLILRLQLRGSDLHASDVAFLSLTGVAILLTGSRAGFAAYAFFAAAVVFRRPRIALALGATAAASFLLFPALGFDVAGPVEAVIDRQAALVAPFRTENLAGRWEIWTLSVQAVAAEPLALLFGNGFGTAIDFVGHNAHMMPLQVLVELGVIGLIAFGAVVVATLRRLAGAEPGNRVLFWGTTALLLSSLTQETLYPSPAFGSFVALFLAAFGLFVSQRGAMVRRRIVGGSIPRAGTSVLVDRG